LCPDKLIIMEYGDIKTIVQTMYGQYVGAGKLIEDTSGSPTALAVLFDLVHNRISNYPREWEFLKETGTLTLTGASSYNLVTTFPSLKSVYQIYGISTNQDSSYLPNYEANILPIDNSHSLRNKTLIFTGNAPQSGTATIQYKSKYMVKNAAGTRIQYFTKDTDTTVLDDVNLLIFGIGEYIDWKADSKSQERRLAKSTSISNTKYTLKSITLVKSSKAT